MEAVDPADIADIQVLKGATAARFGVLGNNGVNRINTKCPEEGKVSVTYHSQYQRMSPDNPLEVLTASEFISQGGQDFGSETSWFEEVAESSWGTAQHLAISSGKENTTYQASVTYRDRPGIVQGHNQSSLNTKFSSNVKFAE